MLGHSLVYVAIDLQARLSSGQGDPRLSVPGLPCPNSFNETVLSVLDVATELLSTGGDRCGGAKPGLHGKYCY